MARPSVVFLLYHGKSHFNASFHLARKLAETHDVLFAGVEFFERYVMSQGFQYHVLKTVPFGFGLEKWLCALQRRKPVYWNTLKDRWRDHLYKTREAELNQLIVKHNPSVVLIDAQQATDFIALYPVFASGKIKPCLLHFNLPSTLTEAVTGKWKRMLIQKIKYFGMDDHTIIKRRIRRNKIPAHYFSEQEINYGCVLDRIHDLVLLPRELDFPETKTSALQHYLGFQIDYKRKENFSDEYNHVKEIIREKVRTENTKVIYCSFGTVPLKNEKKVISFLKKLISATEKINAALIISTTLNTNSWTKSDRVYIFSEVPQLDVLSFAGLFITHGGSNSVKESIDRLVPMIVYPIELSIDQPGNAARIVYHKLGLQGDLESESESGLLEKINDLLVKPEYKKQLSKLKQDDSKYSIENIMDIIHRTIVI